MDEAVHAYIDAVDPAHRPMFDRVHRLIMATHPDADVVLSSWRARSATPPGRA